MKNRKGIVRIANVFLDEAYLKALKCIFTEIFPIDIVKTEEYHNTNITIYLAYSMHFRELKEGDKIPEYELILTSIHDPMKKENIVENIIRIELEVKEIINSENLSLDEFMKKIGCLTNK